MFSVAALSPAQLRTDSLPPHPRLLFNAEGIARLKSRIADPAWAANWNAFQSRAEARLKEKVELPPRGSNWGHWYVCPKHGARLSTGKRIERWQWDHICPVDREVLRGDPSRPDRDFDGCVLAGIHDGYAHELQTAGILYQVTGDDRYLQRGREILLDYASVYLSYPLHTSRGLAQIGGGRLSPQTLDESVWLIPAAQGADLLWDKLSDSDRKIIAEKLFLPAARDVILPHHLSIHNIQCWKNSAVGLTGILLGDATLIGASIDDSDRGYRVQMSKGVQADGVWHEGAWGYHFYTLNALWPLVEAARNCGIDLYGEPLKKMFEAPIQLAMPNLILPAFNDSTEVNVRNPLYELAYARYHDPLYLLALAGVNRSSDYALWFGQDKLPAAAAGSEPRSRNAVDSGYAILERGAGTDATWLCLKYGPHGGGHGHPDKNNFVLYARGRVLFPDPGTRPYGSPLHGEWDRVTLSHNTLVVDEKSQRPATGTSLAFGSDHGADYAMTDAGDIYDGVRFVRTAVLLDRNLVLFVDQVQADKSHTFDLACHSAGRWVKPAAGEKVQLPGTEGYQHLQDVSGRSTSDGATLMLEDSGQSHAIILAGNEQTQVITGTGVGTSTEDRVPAAIFRRKGLQANYVWAASLDGKPVRLEVRGGQPGEVGVKVDTTWNVSVDREHATVQVVHR